MFMKSYNLEDLLKRINALENENKRQESLKDISNWDAHYKKEYKWEINPNLYHNNKNEFSLYIYESAYDRSGTFIQKRRVCDSVPSEDANLVPVRPESE